MQTIIQSTCNRCRQPFDAKCFEFAIGGSTRRLQVSICSDCESELERIEQEKLAADEKLNRAMKEKQREEAWSHLCPAEFRLRSEAEGNTDIARLELEQPKLKLVLAWKYGPRGLIVRGLTGRCKTRSTWRLMRRLWLEHRTIIALTSAEFDRECRDAGGQFRLTQWFNRLAFVDVLFIDDLGKGNWSEATEAQWFDLVDKRTREHRPIVVTTQDDGQSLSSRMSLNRGEALIRRLQEYCECVVFGDGEKRQ